MPSFAAQRTFDSNSGPWETGRLSALWQVPLTNRYKITIDSDGTDSVEFYFYAVGDARVSYSIIITSVMCIIIFKLFNSDI